MTVNPVSGVNAAATTAPAAQPAPGTLDKDAFLELLVASLKYQDPSSPMDTTELMNQTTQLATMEQLTEMTQLSQESFALQARTSATALVGQEISYLNDDGVATSGVVETVDLSGPVPTVVVGDARLTLDAITAVGAARTTTPPSA